MYCSRDHNYSSQQEPYSDYADHHEEQNSAQQQQVLNEAATNQLLQCSVHLPRYETHPTKVQALQDLPTPDNQTKLQSFLEFINYLQPFIPGLADKTMSLSGQFAKCYWKPLTDTAFQHPKFFICSTLLRTTLTYYDKTQPVKVQTDTSKYGLGVILVQNG